MRKMIKLLDGREGDIIVKIPEITQKLIILKGVDKKLKDRLRRIITREIIDELITKAYIEKRLKERPHCIVIVSADILLQEILREIGIEEDVITNVKESIGAAHYCYSFYGAREEEEIEIEPYEEDPEISKCVEEIERQLETSQVVEEASQENENIIEIVVYDKGTYKIKTIPREKITEYIEEEVERKVIRITTYTVIKKRNDPRKHDYSHYITINVRVSHIKELEVNKSYRARIKIPELGIEKETIVTIRARKDEKGAKYITMMVRLGRRGETGKKVRVEIGIEV